MSTDYRLFFGLASAPFGKESADVTIETADYLEMTGRLRYLLQVKGIGLFTGRPGTGKTYTLRMLFSSLNPSLYQTVYLPMSTLTELQFYQYLSAGLGLEKRHTKVANFMQIQERLDQMEREKRVLPVIVLDEAQHLSSRILNDLKMILNFDMDSRSRCAVILSGLPSLASILRYSTYEALRQRIVIQYRMTGLDENEIRQYTEKKLEAAGVLVPVFADSAYHALSGACQGSARRLNSLLTGSLIIAASRGEKTIGSETVMLASQEVDIA